MRRRTVSSKHFVQPFEHPLRALTKLPEFTKLGGAPLGDKVQRTCACNRRPGALMKSAHFQQLITFCSPIKSARKRRFLGAANEADHILRLRLRLAKAAKQARRAQAKMVARSAGRRVILTAPSLLCGREKLNYEARNWNAVRRAN